ncbi:SH3 domain-containing protein [Pseudaminobacter sp. 19-2017]|uniref:SH3 domain-containing protein n=1 Tax=Pseudaminobacter soli (ex Zhang et al. 2022) TaxID=2831468 RepID=A0A942E144_9HYPH|nr:SH3 domain-containing protein [Pseudaminobacter soli]
MIGAVAAGAWAMTQEPPKREHWQRQRQSDVASAEKKPAQVSKPVPAKVTAPKAEARPTQVLTASIPRPEKPVAPTLLRTRDKVRLRKEPSTSSAVVTMLKGGQQVAAAEREGKWRKVSVDGRVGWVHGDYLVEPQSRPIETAAVPRPKVEVAPDPKPVARPTPSPVSAPASDKSIWGALRPARSPQDGDCQCPYDLMLNGKQCGDRSAFARGKGEEQCYF